MKKIVLLGMIVLSSACSERRPPPAAPAEAPGTTAAASAAPGATATASTVPGATTPESSVPPPAPSAGPDLLRSDGIGAIRFGMTLAQAEQAAGGKASLPEPFDPACSMVRFAALPKLRFMVEQGVVTRADAEAGVANAAGIAVGDTLAQVRASHPEAQVGPHKYDANGHVITIPGPDGRAAIIAEETGGKVSKVRAGLQPAVAYVETCG